MHGPDRKIAGYRWPQISISRGRLHEILLAAINERLGPQAIATAHHLTSLEQAYDQTHGFALDMYNINLSMEPGKYEEVHFVADRAGVFPFYCTEFCSALHLEMQGWLLVN